MRSTTHLTAVRCFEFCYPQVDTLLEVQEFDDHVEVRATRDPLSEEQKRAFIRGIADEGFISAHYRSSPIGRGPTTTHSIHWIIDHSWLEITEEILGPSRRLMTRLFIAAGLLSVSLIGFLAHLSSGR
jgi:hypothetical protein